MRRRTCPSQKNLSACVSLLGTGTARWAQALLDSIAVRRFSIFHEHNARDLLRGTAFASPDDLMVLAKHHPPKPEEIMNTKDTRTNTDPGRAITKADSNPRPESSPNASYNRTNQG